MYTAYVSNHDAAQTLLQQLEKNKDFATFCAKQAALSGASLQSLLIGPIQRVPRYSLLLQELLRKTPSTHPDFAALTRSLSLINEAASHINESVRAAQNRAQILALQERFGQSLTLLAPGRWFVRQGALTKQGRHSDVEYQFLLFSDVLLYAAPTTLGNQLRLHRSIPLDSTFHFASLPDETFEEASASLTHTLHPHHVATSSLSVSDADHGPLSSSSVAVNSLTSPMSDLASGPRLRSESADITHTRSPSSTAGGGAGAAAPELANTPSSTSTASAAATTAAPAPASTSTPTTTTVRTAASVNRFLIETRERSFVVYAKTAQLKREWLSDLQAVTLQIKLLESQRSENVALARAADVTVDDKGHARSASRNNSISLPPGSTIPGVQQHQSSPVQAAGIGARPPVLQQFKSTSSCVVCAKLCTSFSGRRHCQACGHIACSRCCRRELFLTWAQKEMRVCELCVEKFKAAKIERDRRASLDAAMHAAGMSTSPLPPGPAPPLPARPAHSHHLSPGTSYSSLSSASSTASSSSSSSISSSSSSYPSRPSRPSKSKVSLLLHSRMGSDAIPHAVAEAGLRPAPADINSDDEPEDLAGVLSPKAKKTDDKLVDP
jgi:hypothetical protein